ncbi:MAG: hypothetical protein KZQ65_10825 [Candidatus Thiodiazotropha sp. (ex Gloverina cf. vestifex)]|nr:hypothetical protein [Candidatus Thiodiazotropha sp. (ex Gloverina cf. vestifex)]
MTMTTEAPTSQLCWLRRLMASPVGFPHAVDRIKHIETHISHLLLVGDFAYKIKKPIDLGFLDFSSLEKRRVCCEEDKRVATS